jgi:hypothetical protein
MSPWRPCKRRIFVKKLRCLGFDGPYSGSRHQFLVFQEDRLTIPSNDEYSIPQLRMVLREAEEILGRPISESEWNSLG